MGITERRQKEKQELRTNILATAWRLVEEEGWQSLSIRKIADAIKYSIPVIYDYFENKEAILSEFAKEGFLLLSKRVKQAKGKHSDPKEQIRAIAHAYWNFAARNRQHFQLMYGLGMPGCEINQCLPGGDGFRGQVMEPIAALISKGKNPYANPCLKYYTFWSILHGLISIKTMRGSTVTDEVNKLVLEDAIAGFIKNLE